MISILGLTACVHRGVHQSERAPVISAPPHSAPPTVVTEPPAPVPAPIPPRAAATPPPVDDTSREQSQPVSPANPKPSTAASNPTLQKAAPAPSTPKPQLDFKAIEQRLRDTSAIGVFTKLSIKNQVDDLLRAFRAYHAGRTPPTLDDLHQRYEGLLLKVVSLVQNDDPQLASSISASRSAIWERLSNRESFQAI